MGVTSEAVLFEYKRKWRLQSECLYCRMKWCKCYELFFLHQEAGWFSEGLEEQDFDLPAVTAFPEHAVSAALVPSPAKQIRFPK